IDRYRRQRRLRVRTSAAHHAEHEQTRTRNAAPLRPAITNHTTPHFVRPAPAVVVWRPYHAASRSHHQRDSYRYKMMMMCAAVAVELRIRAVATTCNRYLHNDSKKYSSLEFFQIEPSPGPRYLREH